VLHLNLQGTNSAYGPWRNRYARIAAWMAATNSVTDIFLLQETSASKCYVFHCDPKAYEAVFLLMDALERKTGVLYRVAVMSTGGSTEGGFPLFQGNAILYNPVRLTNTTEWDRYSQYWTSFGRTVDFRDSFPVRCEWIAATLFTA
jgi:hypothetical protein